MEPLKKNRIMSASVFRQIKHTWIFLGKGTRHSKSAKLWEIHCKYSCLTAQRLIFLSLAQ